MLTLITLKFNYGRGNSLSLSLHVVLCTGLMLMSFLVLTLMVLMVHSPYAAKVLQLTLQRPLHLEPYCRSRDPTVTVHAYDLCLSGR